MGSLSVPAYSTNELRRLVLALVTFTFTGMHCSIPITRLRVGLKSKELAMSMPLATHQREDGAAHSETSMVALRFKVVRLFRTT
jgi:hypothetical protein